MSRYNERVSGRRISLTTLLPLAVFLLAVGARLLPGPRTIDDSYITFRYARNILAGNGFVYNPGERVLGTTTPFYTVLLAFLAAPLGGVKAPFPEIALGINALTDGLTCLLLLRLGRRLAAPRAGLAAALVWAVAPFSVTFAVGGLETSIYVLLLTGIAAAYLEHRTVLTAALAGLSLLTRPDALIFLGPLGLDWLLSKAGSLRKPDLARLRSLARPVATFLITVLPWLVFATLYFGSPLPHSVAAKSVAYRLPATAAFVRLLQHYATPFVENLTFGGGAIAVGLVLYPFLFLAGALKVLRQERRAWPFLAYPWLYFATFAIANPLIFRWYLTPPLPAYFFGILVGLDAILQSLAHRLESSQIPEPLHELGETALYNRDPLQLSSFAQPLMAILAMLLVVGGPLALSLRGWELHPEHGLIQPAPAMAYYKLEILYRQAADELSPEITTRPTPPTLAAGDVGVLGFFSGARILDTVGLNSPQATRYYPLDERLYTINYAIAPGLILDQEPDYLVMLEVYGREGLLRDERFQAAYELRLKIPTDMYGSDGMLIFEKIGQ